MRTPKGCKEFIMLLTEIRNALLSRTGSAGALNDILGRDQPNR